MVHRKSKEIAVVCDDLNSGDACTTQRDNVRVRLASDREQDRASAANSTNTAVAREDDPEYQTQKRMRLSMAQVSIIKSQSDIVLLQLKLYTENKE